MFDIAKFDTKTRSEAGVDMPVAIPKPPYAPFLDAAGKPITIKLLGRNSPEFKQLQKDANDRAVASATAGIARTDEDEERDRFLMLVGLTKGWSFDTMDGAPFLFSEENVRRLWCDDRWQWLRVQAYNWVLTEGNFLAL